jgi:hypothetical protein
MTLKYSQQTSMKCSNNKFHKNPSNGSWDIPCGWNNGQTETFNVASSCLSPIPVASRSKAWLCSHSFAVMWVRILLQAWMFGACEYCVSTGRGFCVGLFIYPEESYCMWCVTVWSRDLYNDEALAHKGRADEPMAHMPNMARSIHCCSNFLKLILPHQPL